MTIAPITPITVAIVGGGPGGLGAAIAFSKLPNVTVTIYEQAKVLREVGAGIQIGSNTWRVLRLLGADKFLTTGHAAKEILTLDGKTGEILSNRRPGPSPDTPASVRTQRTKLQSALLAVLPPGILRLEKRLVRLERLKEEGRSLLEFEDGEVVYADLVVGADGIRSVVRQTVFPNHSIRYTGTTIWRTLQPESDFSKIPPETLAGLPANFLDLNSWWHAPYGHFYFNKVGEGLWEIAARYVEDPALVVGKKVSWGVPATNERVESHFTEYHTFVKAALRVVPEGQWREFSAFAGPRLDNLTAWDGTVILIGDASHPLSGAFGSGAGFALEDGWILARALELQRQLNIAPADIIPKATELFNRIRSPYYKRMYEHLDEEKAKQKRVQQQDDQSWGGLTKAKVKPTEGKDMSWIYNNDIKVVWDNFQL